MRRRTTRNKRQHALICAMGSAMGEYFRKTRIVPGDPGGSLSKGLLGVNGKSLPDPVTRGASTNQNHEAGESMRLSPASWLQ